MKDRLNDPSFQLLCEKFGSKCEFPILPRRLTICTSRPRHCSRDNDVHCANSSRSQTCSRDRDEQNAASSNFFIFSSILLLFASISLDFIFFLQDQPFHVNYLKS